MFSSITNSLSRINAKQMVIAAGFVAAMAAAIGLGLATKQYSNAAAARDCDDNAILRCGADDPKEFISDVKSYNTNTQKRQADLQNIYASSYGNLSPSEYTRFQNTAQMGYVDNKGNVVVAGKTVMTGAWSMGRQSFGNPNRKPFTINGKTYYKSPTSVSFASGVKSIPVMVMFDSKGVAESVIMTSCGNPVWGTKKVPSYACKALNHTKISEDTHDFSTSVSQYNATVKDVTYDFGDGTTATETNPAKVVRHKYAKNGTYTVKVTVRFVLPGGKIVTATVENCIKKITVNVPQPYYACDMLDAVALNNEKTKYRFTVKARAGNGAAIKDVDFTLDGKNTTTGVTTEDGQGNIYKDYEFAQDGSSHEVVAKVNFNIASKVTSVTCKAKIEVGKTPECVEKPGSGLPPGHPDCYVCPIPGKEDLPKDKCVENCPIEGKEDLPKDSKECETPEVLPETGMGSVLGIFAGTSAIGAVAHRVISNRRNS